MSKKAVKKAIPYKEVKFEKLNYEDLVDRVDKAEREVLDLTTKIVSKDKELRVLRKRIKELDPGDATIFDD